LTAKKNSGINIIGNHKANIGSEGIEEKKASKVSSKNNFAGKDSKHDKSHQ